MSVSSLRPPPLSQVRLTGGLLAERQRIVREVSLADQYAKLGQTGRLRALELEWTAADAEEYGEPRPHVFWESDIAKWVEAVGYALETQADADLRQMGQHVVQRLIGAQQADGYLNVHYTINEPGRRFTNLRDQHELYDAGHLIEAAVAWATGAGDDSLLRAMRRYADLIAETFGDEQGKKRGYCGHEEIELALVKLAHATGETKYLRLAEFFINERGASGPDRPHYFAAEAQSRGDAPLPSHGHAFDWSYWQAHQPVREQTVPVGHAVRAMYLYAGAMDVAAATGEAALLDTCRKAFDHMLARRTYVHGGVGSQKIGEAFSFDHDLPNEEAYAETCAAIGLILLAQRLLEHSPNGKYADAIERALYNNVLAGLSLDGRRYFYENFLTVKPPYHKHARRRAPERQEWFGCACCPPNVARLLMSLGRYIYGVRERTLYVHQFAASELRTQVGDDIEVTLRQETRYPWDGEILLHVDPLNEADFTLALRLPAWCEAPRLSVNGEIAGDVALCDGYAYLRRTWRAGDQVRLSLPMPPRRVWADPRVRHDVGKVAVTRGPVLFCLEELDNGANLGALALPREAELRATSRADLLDGVSLIVAQGRRLSEADWGDALYRSRPPHMREATLTFVPYFTWANRGPGEMTAWVNDA